MDMRMAWPNVGVVIRQSVVSHGDSDTTSARPKDSGRLPRNMCINGFMQLDSNALRPEDLIS